MFDLHARIHLHEVESAARCIEDELDCTGATIVDLTADPQRGIAHAGADRAVQSGRGAFLDQFLVAPLHRAIALTQVQHRSTVAEYLDLHVPHAFEELLDIEAAVSKRSLSLARRIGEAGRQLLIVAHHAHSAPAAAGSGLE